MRTGGETTRHAELKRLAATWAQANGFCICAPEVQVPRSGFRADVAACTRGPDCRTAVFECKQARSDLLKDSHAEHATRQRLGELTERRRTLEGLLAIHRPDLRRGEALWPEYDTWDFSELEHAPYHRLLRELATVQRRVIKGTKFAKMFRYQCADALYLVSEDGIFAEAEVPVGWGLLVRRGEELAQVRLPQLLHPSVEQRQALLERIAVAATRIANRVTGVRLPAADWTSTEIPES